MEDCPFFTSACFYMDILSYVSEALKGPENPVL